MTRFTAEWLASRLDALAEKQADHFGNFVSKDGFSGEYREGRADAYGRAAEIVREAGHSPDLSVGEGEGLRARIESALREVLDEQNVDLPVSLAVLLTDAVLEVRAALLDPKEEA